ncbi:MAG: class I SAM-dependent methyltransferase [Spirochaetales bacterium]|nr:class I SAM-dependent methyltransferase [Spirochaetales bacterium]
MQIYDTLAPHYSEIFPLPFIRINFISSFSIPADSRILDIGCATGELAIELAKKNYSVTGIDKNKTMISLAKINAKKENVSTSFFAMDMLALSSLDTGPYNLVLCLGNTLPHLESYADVRTFFTKVFSSLASSGLFIFQILNYDNIMSKKKITFPMKETENFIFERTYTFREDEKIDFQIYLKEKKNNNELAETTCLLPLYKDKLITILLQIGFRHIETFSDYNRAPDYPAEFATIYVAKKK